ncbi:hypothetical protein AA313_de0206930 [Arthrobotrys entomopaga]|nr:hypothetical protein AA313_de0206930 [Arthrobotrys entomopaga]
MNGANDPDNQAIFRMVKDVDPDRKRTVGVITKCDRIQSGDEKVYLQVALNQVKKFHLLHGWFVVKNRTTAESEHGLSSSVKEKRTTEEEEFSKKRWSTLDPKRIGVDNLAIFLRGLFHQHVQSEIPKIAREVEKLIASASYKYDKMTKSRCTTDQQRNFLINLASEYEKRINECLAARIGETVDYRSPLKIRTHVREDNKIFGKTMRVDLNLPVPQPEDIYTWIKKTHKESLGTELGGLVDPNIVVEMFREQAKGWRGISIDHIQKVIKRVESFHTEVLRSTVPEEGVRLGLERKIKREFFEATSAAINLVNHLVDIECKGILQTTNRNYTAALLEAKRARITSYFEILLKGYPFERIRNETGERMAQVAMEEFAKLWKGGQVKISLDVELIHDILKAYYPIALERFINTVYSQVIEDQLFGGNGPIHLFNPIYVARLEANELNEIAGEDDEVIKERESLELLLKQAREAEAALNSI